MFSIADLLDAAKAKANIETDYRLGKVLAINHQVLSGYRLGKSLPNDKILAQLCALSGDDVAVIAAEVQAARAQSSEGRTMWMMIAKRLAGGASTAVLSVLFTIALIAGHAPSAYACQSHDAKTGKVNLLYIVSNTILSVHCFVLVRLRRFNRLLPSFIGLCRCAYL